MIKKFIHKKKTNKGDYLIPFLVILLSIVGLIFIYSASNYSANATYGDAYYFVKKQALGIGVGIIAMLLIAQIDYHKLKKYALLFAIVAVVLLLAIFIPGVGVENYGAKRWIGFGSFTIQPSEFAKFALILFSAWYISKDPSKIRTFVGVLPILGYGGLLCVLIIIEPNMSITVCVATLMMAVLFASGMKIKHFLLIFIPIILLGVALILIEPYRLNRLSAFLNPWASPKGEGYQLIQSLYALGSGGWFGVGIFNSRQKYAFLPFSESDFILSVIGEEIGFIGLILFFILLAFIVYRGIKTASETKDVFGYTLAVGITMIFGIQVIVNALVVTGTIPPTGLPLPLVSSGNTSIIVFMTEMGVLYNISKNNKEKFLFS